MKRIFKIFTWLVGISLVTFLLLGAALQFPSTQTFIVSKLTQAFSKQLQTKISIGNIQFRFFKSIEINDVYAEDLQQDTLLALDQLSASIGLFSLLQRNIQLNQIKIKGLHSHLYNSPTDSTFNFQFILDQFASDPNKKTAPESTTTPWQVGFGDITIKNTQFTYQDSFAQLYLNLEVPQIYLSSNELDLATQKINLHQLLIDRPQFNIKTTATAPLEVEDASTLSFPYFGWTLALDELKIKEGNIRYQTSDLPLTTKGFNPAYLDFKNTNLDIEQLTWDSISLATNLKQLSFKDQSGLVLNQTQANLRLSPTQIDIKNLSITTPSSQIKNTTNLSFPNWEALPDFLQQVDYQSQFSESYLSFQDLEYFIPFIPSEYRIKSPLSLSGTLQGKKATLNLQRLKLKIGDYLDFYSTGQIKNIDEVDRLSLDLDLKKLEIAYKKLRLELPVLGLPDLADSLGNISLAGQFQGTLNQLNFQNILLNTSANTFIKTDGKLNNLTSPKALRFALNIDSIHTKAEDLAYFSSSSLPPGLYEMNNINYQGLLSGTLQEFTSKGKLGTAIGFLNTDISIAFNKEYSNASYNGNFELNNFDLGRFLGDTATFGKANLEATLAGEGFQLDNIDTELNAKVNSIVFNKYNYQKIAVNGHLAQSEFVGDAGMEDENLTFDFKGLVNLKEKEPRFDFQTTIDTIDFKALGFYDQALNVSGKIISNFSGNNIDNFNGKASLDDWHLSNDSLHFFSDSLILQSYPKGLKDKALSIQSDWLSADISGEFLLANLPDLITNFINDYFPIDQLLSPVDRPDSLAIEPFAQKNLTDQKIIFQLKAIHPENITKLFTSTLESVDSVVVKGTFDSMDKQIDLSLNSSNLKIVDWSIDSLVWTLKGDARQVQSKLRLPDLDNGAMNFRNNQITTTLSDNKLATKILVNSKEETSVFEWGASVSPIDDHYQLTLDDTLLVDQQLWNLDPEHEIFFQSGYLHIRDFTLNKNRQFVSIKSYDKPKDEDFTPIEASFSNFQLNELSSLTNLEGFEYSGLLNGTVRANDLTDNLHYIADLEMDQVMVNDTLIGTFVINAEQNLSAPEVLLSVQLAGNGNELLAQGSYNLESNQFDINADIQRIPLILIDPFSAGAIQNSSGFLTGAFTLKGSPDQPLINGQLSLQKASTKINYLQTRYTIPEHTIYIKEKGIDLGELLLLDTEGNKAFFSGTIQHQNYETFRLNLTFKTVKFKFLNTKSNDNDLFYGTLLLGALVNIGGTLDLPKIVINAATQAGSQLYVNAITEEEITKPGDYIIFGKPGAIPLDSILEIQNKGNYGSLAFDLLLNLDLTPDAELIVIIDPSTGDKLRCTGNANMTVVMPPSGDINITGIYTVVNGTYQFNYQGLVKRSFNLVPGGQLTFIGDPLQTRFNLTAKYRTRTNLYSLIANESSLSETATSHAKERADVDVLLSMAGDLDEPKISFDLSVPDLNNSELNTLTTQKINQLNEDQSELNKQVFGLLLLNSFVTEQSSNASLSSTGENIALSSVSNLISNQLNRLSDQYAKGLGLTFDLESNRSQFGEESSSTRTNLNVGLSQSLLNDRLKLKVGGVAQVQSNADSGTASSLSNIAGDFVLEYQLTKSGNYLLRVFQRSDYDTFNDSNVSKTGVGVSFKKSFGK